jgi:hypothetical protein
MILDRLADLKSLAGRASSTASTSNVDAAFADIETRLAGARGLFTELGMARIGSLKLLDPTEVTSVTETARRLRGALDVLDSATDEGLAVYASAGADARGSLVAVTRQAQALRSSLLTSQQVMLRRLAERVWPDEDTVRLDVIAHLSDNRPLAAAARRTEVVHERLLERAATDIGMPAAELDGLISDATAVAVHLDELRAEPVPDEVVAFWKEASSEIGASLDEVTPTVRAWLEEHDGLRSFTVRRER